MHLNLIRIPVLARFALVALAFGAPSLSPRAGDDAVEPATDQASDGLAPIFEDRGVRLYAATIVIAEPAATPSACERRFGELGGFLTHRIARSASGRETSITTCEVTVQLPKSARAAFRTRLDQAMAQNDSRLPSRRMTDDRLTADTWSRARDLHPMCPVGMHLLNPDYLSDGIPEELRCSIAMPHPCSEGQVLAGGDEPACRSKSVGCPAGTTRLPAAFYSFPWTERVGMRAAVDESNGVLCASCPRGRLELRESRASGQPVCLERGRAKAQ